jgi:hypothetical protein
MANFPQFPGVLSNEIDNTFTTSSPVKAGAAIMGPTVKGPIEVPIIVTSYSDYENRFGSNFISGSDNYSYLTSIAAYNYFNSGGNSLLVARIVSGSYTPALSTSIPNNNTTYFDLDYADGDYLVGDENTFILETLSEGEIMNSESTASIQGSLPSGSIDNLRWEITNSNTSSGTFTLLIRRGDDKTNDKIILESYNNVSLDPLSNRYVERVIGNQSLNYNPTTNQIETSGSFPNISRYVRVKQVLTPTPNYLDNDGNAKPEYVNYIPVPYSGSFNGATGNIMGGANFYENINDSNTQGLVASNYDNMIDLLSNSNAYKFNILMTPGLIDNLPSHTSKISTIITNTQNRGDNVYLLDLTDSEASVLETTIQASSRNSSYAASYYPWIQIIDPSTGKRVFTPPSTLIAGRYAFTDRVAKEWYAPAGKKRGVISALKPKFQLSEQNKVDLYAGKVNPIITLQNKAVTVYGQKTLQTEQSALSSINVRRLLIELKSYISQLAEDLVFEQNTQATRNAFLAKVNPYLESVQQNLGLYAFKVIMDDTNNTPDLIDRNQLIGQFYIQPTRTVEFVALDFILSPTGAAFPA